MNGQNDFLLLFVVIRTSANSFSKFQDFPTCDSEREMARFAQVAEQEHCFRQQLRNGVT